VSFQSGGVVEMAGYL